MKARTLAAAVALGLVVASCTVEVDQGIPETTTTTGAETTAPSGPDTLTIISHDSFAAGVTDGTFASFTEETGIEVEVLPAGDAGVMVNQAILTIDNPLADVLFGIDDTFLSRALDAEIFEPYQSSLLSTVPDALELDPSVTPISFGDVCINYDRSVYSDSAPPLNLEQLTLPQFRDQLVVEDPASSSPGLAFLFATIAAFGSEWQGYWEALKENGVKVVSDWDTAYYGESTWWGGDRPLVVSYASSPPAEVLFSEEPITEAPTGVIDETCYRQIEFAGVLAGSEYPEEAKALIDYMLSPDFQEQIPLAWFVFPANETVELPTEFTEYTTVPAAPASLDPVEIEANRELWIEEWTAIMTR